MVFLSVHNNSIIVPLGNACWKLPTKKVSLYLPDLMRIWVLQWGPPSPILMKIKLNWWKSMKKLKKRKKLKKKWKWKSKIRVFGVDSNGFFIFCWRPKSTRILKLLDGELSFAGFFWLWAPLHFLIRPYKRLFLLRITALKEKFKIYSTT